VLQPGHVAAADTRFGVDLHFFVNRKRPRDLHFHAAANEFTLADWRIG
jgi:hypothetical protein